jgi:surfeit locus 1 family protein
MEPIELSGAPTDTAGLDFRAARLLGVWDHDRSMAYAARSRGGLPGVHVLTPVRTEDGRAVLVDRGFVPAVDAATVALEPLRATGPANVVGRLRSLPTEGGQGSLRFHADSLRAMPTWFALSLGGIEEHVPYAIAPLYLVAEERTGPDPYPAPARVPEPDDGPHLGYALQWFSFAAIAVIGWVALLAKGGAARGTGRRRLADPKEREA